MLSIHNLTYRIGTRTLLEGAQARIMPGWKVGVVGANGIGKSTLFKLIMGELEADAGQIEWPSDLTVGVVRQDIPDDETALIDVVLAADTERALLLQQAETETDPYKIGDIHSRLQEIDAYAAPAKAASILSGLGFQESQMHEPISAFSGGWRMRVALAAVLFKEPDFLLLDEPTNHLDMEALIWLENYLTTYPHTMMVISHDRALLNLCTDHILHVENKQLTLYTGNYDTFERERAEKRGLQQKMHEKQQAQRAHMQKFVDRFRAKATKAKQAQSRLKALERMDLVDAVIADRAIVFSFPQPEELPPPLLHLDTLTIGYTPDLPVVKRIDARLDMDDRIALLGANGNGKSTLIKTIAGVLAPLSGQFSASEKLRIGYFAQHQTEALDVNATPFEEMARLLPGKTATDVRKKLGQFGFGKELADSRIGTLSGGEKARFLFAVMSLHAPHLLLLDEPTNHLDIDAREALVQALNAYEGAVILVSHDPNMVERVADKLWLVKDGRCQPFGGDLEAYRAFVIQEKRNARRAQRVEADREKEALGHAEQGESALDKKAQKALEAKKRKQFPELLKAIGQAERDVARWAGRKKELEAQMADPAFYEDAAAVKEAQFAYGKVLAAVEEAELHWLEAQEAYENAVPH